MRADFHVHTEYSDDSSYPLDDVCRDAIKLGLDEICITDHVDYGVKVDPTDLPDNYGSVAPDGFTFNVDYDRYFPHVMRVREQFAAQGLAVRCGLELGVQSHRLRASHALVEAHRDELDFTLLSIHEIGDEQFWNGHYQEGRSQRQLNEGYYEELLRCVESFEDYSVLAHLDLVRRYDPYGAYPFEAVRDILAAILERVIADGRGIELNSSSFRYGLDDLQPSREILRLYRDLDGTVLTLGSDSHKPEHLGAHLDEVCDELRSMGYDHFCTFEHWQPIFHEM